MNYQVCLYASEEDSIDPIQRFNVDADNLREASFRGLSKLKEWQIKEKYEVNKQPNFDNFTEVPLSKMSTGMILSDGIEREENDEKYIFEVEVREVDQD